MNSLEKPSKFWQKSSFLLFAREILKNPRAMGAACPSSHHLAHALAAPVPIPEQGLVVELGAGTGSVTAALLKRGIPAKQLIAIERAHNLATFLHQQFPHIHVKEGDASQLKNLIAEYKQPITAIVSGLPLRSLPRETVKSIIIQIDNILSAGGLYIQFTYDIARRNHYLPAHFEKVGSKLVWQNLPPARVDIYRVRCA